MSLLFFVVATGLAQTPAAPAPTAPSYPTAVHAQLSAMAPAFLTAQRADLKGIKGAAVTVLEVEIARDGTARRLGIALSSGANVSDDLARQLVLAAEPFPPPTAEALGMDESVTCLMRVALSTTTAVSAVACFPPNKALAEVAGQTNGGAAKDAGAYLFAAWASEGSGNVKAAVAGYQRAAKMAPEWDYAARAFGLALVNQRKHAQAMPYLQTYLEQHAVPADVSFLAREVDRFAKFQKAKQDWEKRVREHLSKRDIAEGINRGLDILEPCLEAARQAYVLEQESDTLVMSWKIKKDGTVYGTRLEGPSHVVLSAHSDCIEKAAGKWQFPKYSQGDEVVIKELPIKVKGSPEKPKPRPRPKASAELASGTASVSQCMRGQKEIFTYIKSRLTDLNRCVQRERARYPRADYPKKLGLSFVVEPVGDVTQIIIKHRHFRTGPFAECINKALAGKLAPLGGTPCPASFDLQL